MTNELYMYTYREPKGVSVNQDSYIDPDVADEKARVDSAESRNDAVVVKRLHKVCTSPTHYARITHN